ncbi:MAG: DNA gyrase subunit A [Candidatus Aenigmarchaeota archaeon]|nr:DNA gyrase subunit A [Candidatus Aenigmarchaeota archaeon]
MEKKQEDERTIKKPIEDEMKENYIDYAMSVIIGRALPDVRDGLKPVHRRVLFAMQELGLLHNRPFRKSARIVGDVLGKYHPHGDQAAYDTLVRMAQWFSLRYLLIDGQGNFGSIDGDPPAAMRYTEARFTRIAEELLRDIDMDTVDFVPNFDGSMKEPVLLPNRFPNLLVNGSSGIAVGMSTSMPPHNLGEICDAVVMLVDDPQAEADRLMTVVRGPDFPTGGIICGKDGILRAYKTGRGSLKVRALVETEDDKTIIIKEIPYMVNKSSLIEHMAELVKNKQVDGIRTIRDESDKDGMRIVIELQSGVSADLILNKLYQHTELESTFGIINLAIVDNRPKVMNLKELLHHFIEHRKDIIVRRTRFLLQKAKDRAHILEGLKIALANIDRVVSLIKRSKDPVVAKKGLMSSFKLSGKQADAILQMRLQTLTGLEQGKIKEEYDRLIQDIEKYKKILRSEHEVLAIVREETIEVKDKYADARRTRISDDISDLCELDLVPEDDMVVTMTSRGYVKRIPVEEYRMQKRGGKGITATGTGEDGFVKEMFIANNHDYLLFFSNKGRVHWLRTFQLPTGSRYSRGKAIVNYVHLDEDESISTTIPLRDFDQGKFLLFSTRLGQVKKTAVKAYSRPRKGGIIAINLRKGDRLIDVELTDGKKRIFLATKNGKAIRFSERDVRGMGRSASGVRGIRLRRGDEVIGMEILEDGEQILTVSELGYGKRTEGSFYKVQRRGGKGLINMKVVDKNGPVKAIKKVTGEEGEQLMLISSQGTAIRVATNGISLIGRSTQGVRVMRLDEGDRLEDMELIQDSGNGGDEDGGEDTEGAVERSEDDVGEA